MSLTIPIDPIPNQKLTVQLGGQNCQIEIRQKSTGVFLNLAIDGVYLLLGALCLDRVPVIFPDYRGFKGWLQFEDSQGTNDPEYTGFNTRYFLRYHE